MKKNIKKINLSLAFILMFLNKIAFASNVGEDAGWELIDVARKGLKWVCLFVSFYGLYLQVLKKDDAGKKIIINCFIVYVLSYVLPKIYIIIQGAFTK